MTFIGDDADDQYQKQLASANKRLTEANAIMFAKSQKLGQAGIQLNPVDLAMLRLNTLIEAIWPSEQDDNYVPNPDDPTDQAPLGNMDRIVFEQMWTEELGGVIDHALAQFNKMKLLQGVNGAQASEMLKRGGIGRG